MARSSTAYTCQQCGATFRKWMGRCENCGAWNSLVEEVIKTDAGKAVVNRSKGEVLKATKLSDVKDSLVGKRLKSGMTDIDEVLGGGFVKGGVILLAGQPGIGKSTLLLQIANMVSDSHRSLYVTGEESIAQVKSRAQRLSDNARQLDLVSSTSADDIATTIMGGGYDFVVVDSLQTLTVAEVSSAPGTVSQITNASNLIIRAAKKSDTAVIMVGHVTKEGSIAGPKVVEHLVDVVLQFEGDRYGGFKMVRAAKNRYGSTAELAILEMSDKGLESVSNPSAHLLAERSDSDGSVVLATMEGNRALLVEIQALVSTTNFGYPKRTASGFDLNRLNILIAVLEKRTKLNLGDKDIFINVVGGMKLRDPAADLAVCMAIASAAAERRLDDDTVVFGEIGLGGEIRTSQGSDKRIAEAKKLGFKKALAPGGNKDKFVYSVKDLRQALRDHLTNI